MACVSCGQILQYLHDAHACNTQKTSYTWALFEVHFHQLTCFQLPFADLAYCTAEVFQHALQPNPCTVIACKSHACQRKWTSTYHLPDYAGMRQLIQCCHPPALSASR